MNSIRTFLFRVGRVVCIGVSLGAGLLSGPVAADELDDAADALAKLGSATPIPTPVARPPETGKGGPAPRSIETPPDSTTLPAGLRGIFAGKTEDPVGSNLVQVVGAKIKWVFKDRRSWVASKTNTWDFTQANGKLTITRTDGGPLVYRVSDDQKSLTWESGDGNVAQQLASPPR